MSASQNPRNAEISGWSITIQEISPGVYEVIASDSLGRSFRSRGFDAAELLEEARQYAARFENDAASPRDAHEGSGDSKKP